MTETQNIVQELSDLIEVEQEAVLRGDLAVVQDLVDRKAALIGQINGAAARGHAELPELQRRIARNQQLLQKAMDGIHAVSERLKKLRDARVSLTVYDAQGQAQRYGTERKPEFERRA